MDTMHYVGLDIHKKMVAYCVKKQDGQVVREGSVPATRKDFTRWVGEMKTPWTAAMEATLFTGWIYDFLKPHAHELKVAHPKMLHGDPPPKKNPRPRGRLEDQRPSALQPPAGMLHGR
jgi:transposase